MRDGSPLLPALLLIAPLLAGCLQGGDATTLRIDFGGALPAVAATVEPEGRPASSRHQAEGAAPPGHYSAFDQLVQWSQETGRPVEADYDARFGFFLCNIDGQPGRGGMAYWSLEVNGTVSEVGMSEVKVVSGSEISWTLTPSDFPNCPDVSTPAAAPAGPLELSAPAQAITRQATVTVNGTVSQGARLSYRAGALAGEVAHEGAAWSLTLPVQPGHTLLALTADDGEATLERNVTLVREAAATLEVRYNGYPGHADRSDEVWYDPGAFLSAPDYEGRDLQHPDHPTVHDLMATWTAATGVAVTYAYSNGLGHSVSSIDGVGSPLAVGLLSTTWCYDRNGASADKGISTQELAPGDTITWVLGCA